MQVVRRHHRRGLQHRLARDVQRILLQSASRARAASRRTRRCTTAGWGTRGFTLRKPSRTRASSSPNATAAPPRQRRQMQRQRRHARRAAREPWRQRARRANLRVALDGLRHVDEARLCPRAVHASAHHGALPSCTGTWTKLDFALAPKTGTNCVGIEVDSDPGGSLRVSPGPSKATRAFGVADGLPSA